MPALLLLMMITAKPATEPPTERGLELHVWSEPLTLGVNALTVHGGSYSVVVPLGAEYRVSERVWVGVELTLLLHREPRNLYRSNGLLGAFAVQVRLFDAGPVSFFVEPRLVFGLLDQKASASASECDDMCEITGTETEIGIGVVLGASLAWRGLYLAMVLGGQLTSYSGGDASVVGLTFTVMGSGIGSNGSGGALTPNLTLLRVGVNW